MEHLRDILTGTWIGEFGYAGRSYSRPTNFEAIGTIDESSQNLKFTANGQDTKDSYGPYKFEGVAFENKEISFVQKFGNSTDPGGWWWMKATVDIEGKKMSGNWGRYTSPDRIDGSLMFERQWTEQDSQREAAAAKQKKEREVAAALAKQMQEAEVIARGENVMHLLPNTIRCIDQNSIKSIDDGSIKIMDGRRNIPEWSGGPVEKISDPYLLPELHNPEMKYFFID